MMITDNYWIIFQLSWWVNATKSSQTARLCQDVTSFQEPAVVLLNKSIPMNEIVILPKILEMHPILTCITVQEWYQQLYLNWSLYYIKLHTLFKSSIISYYILIRIHIHNLNYHSCDTMTRYTAQVIQLPHTVFVMYTKYNQTLLHSFSGNFPA